MRSDWLVSGISTFLFLPFLPYEANLENSHSQFEKAFIIPAENTDDIKPVKGGRTGGLLQSVHEGVQIEIEISSLSTHSRRYDLPVLDDQKSKLTNPICVQWGEAPTCEELDPNQCLEWNEACVEWDTPCVREEKKCIETQQYCCKTEQHCVCGKCKEIGFLDLLPLLCHDECVQTCSKCTKEIPVCVERVQRCTKNISTNCKRYGTKKVHNGPSPCIQTENQWLRVYSLSQLVATEHQKVDFSQFDAKAILDGIKIQLSGFEPNPSGTIENVTRSCSLAVFDPMMAIVQEKLKINFTLKNEIEKQCLLFNDWNRKLGYAPELFLVNQISVSETFPCGIKEELWNGTTHYSCPETHETSTGPLFNVYYPRFEIQGAIRLLFKENSSDFPKKTLESKAQNVEN